MRPFRGTLQRRIHPIFSFISRLAEADFILNTNEFFVYQCLLIISNHQFLYSKSNVKF